MKKESKINFFPSLLSAFLGLSLYFLIYLPIEFLLTEVFFVVPKINLWINTGVLLLFLLIANLFDLERMIKNRKKVSFLLIFIFTIFTFYGFYHHVKLEKEYLPKIYQFEPAWIIQGQRIKIEGVNFGPFFKRGKVIVDDMEFLVRDWGENEIIAEAPVPSKQGHFPLSIETKEGKLSNVLIIEIKDPSYLERYLR